MPPQQNFLGEFEQMVLLAVLQLDNSAYTVPIRSEITNRTGRAVSRGALYTTLERLEAKEILDSALGEPSAQRGGRAKRFWHVTEKGIELLRQTRMAMHSMSDGLDSMLRDVG